MKKMRLLDLLVLVYDNKLPDGQMVLIDNDCFKFVEKEKKFYVPDSRTTYRNIFTNQLDLTCYILEDFEK